MNNESRSRVLCVKCQVPLEEGKVSIAYLSNTFYADLLRCPLCGQVFIPEELALGRMAEVEKTLEDK
jgi:uncharacterized protein with PIN domain